MSAHDGLWEKMFVILRGRSTIIFLTLRQLQTKSAEEHAEEE